MGDVWDEPQRNWLADLRSALLPERADGAARAGVAVEAGVAGSHAMPDELADVLGGIVERLDAIDAAVQSGRPDLTVVEARLAALDTRVVAVADAVGLLAQPAPPDERLDVIVRRPDPAERIDALARALAALPDAISAQLSHSRAELLADLDARIETMRAAWADAETASKAELAAAVETVLAAVDAASDDGTPPDGGPPPEVLAVRQQLDGIAERLDVIERAMVALATMARDEIDRGAAGVHQPAPGAPAS